MLWLPIGSVNAVLENQCRGVIVRESGRPGRVDATTFVGGGEQILTDNDNRAACVMAFGEGECPRGWVCISILGEIE